MRTESSKTFFNPVEVISLGFLWVLVVIIFAPLLTVVVSQRIDYGLHLFRAQTLANGMNLSEFLATSPIPNFLFEVLVAFTYSLLPHPDILSAAYIVALAFYLLLAVVIYWLIRAIEGRPTNYWAGGKYVLCTLVAMLVAPIFLLTPDNPYFGYIAINVYHSPTMVLLKPFAVLQFHFAITAFDFASIDRARNHWLRVAVVTVFSTLAKPSYTIVLLPALAVRAIYAYRKKEAVNWWLLVGGLVLPAVITIGAQSVFFDAGAFRLAPLAVFQEWAAQFNPKAADGLVLKFVLSILFPLVVYIMYGEQARRNRYLNFSWLCFGFGAAYTYLFVEANRVAHGNFTWSSGIALFVLFLTSLIFFLRQNRTFVVRPAFIVGITILALHLVSGIVWFQVHLIGMQDMQWNLW
jgi:hypothetical protein